MVNTYTQAKLILFLFQIKSVYYLINATFKASYIALKTWITVFLNLTILSVITHVNTKIELKKYPIVRTDD